VWREGKNSADNAHEYRFAEEMCARLGLSYEPAKSEVDTSS
jgi:hypothetical protein